MLQFTATGFHKQYDPINFEDMASEDEKKEALQSSNKTKIHRMQMIKPTKEQIDALLKAFFDAEQFIEMAETDPKEWDEFEGNPFNIRSLVDDDSQFQNSYLMARKEAMLSVCRVFTNTSYEMIVLALQTLLDNCTDPNNEILAFSPEIKSRLACTHCCVSKE